MGFPFFVGRRLFAFTASTNNVTQQIQSQTTQTHSDPSKTS